VNYIFAYNFIYYTDTYLEGIHKLKIAEKYSEVESASDADPKAKRAKRQLRAKKNLFENLSESDSDNKYLIVI